MRIAIATLFKEEMGGGVGRVVYEMIEHLSRQHELVVICPGEYTGRSQAQGNWGTFFVKSQGEGNAYFPALSQGDIRRTFRLLDEFKPDIVHTHTPLGLSYVVQFWARLNVVPFVSTVHLHPSKVLEFGADEVIRAVRALRRPLNWLMIEPAVMHFYGNCDAIIVPNDSVVEGIQRSGFKGPLFTIPNGRDLHLYTSCAFTSLELPHRTLTSIGYLNERKNQLYLLRVLRCLPRNYRLQLIGGTLPLSLGYLERLQSFSEEHGLEVIFRGQVEHKDIPTYLAGTHLYISASTMEIQSLAVIEALASGTPVVGISNEAVDELVDGTVGYRLPKTASPEEFARCVKSICDLSQSAYEGMCGRARARVEHCDWPRSISRTVEVYKSLTVEEGPGSEARKGSDSEVLERESWEELSGWRKARRAHLSSWLFLFLTSLVSSGVYLVLGLQETLRRSFDSRTTGSL